jgi:hypothetical protein
MPQTASVWGGTELPIAECRDRQQWIFLAEIKQWVLVLEQWLMDRASGPDSVRTPALCQRRRSSLPTVPKCRAEHLP